MKAIELTKGKFALIDDEDFDLVSKFKWHVSGCKNYAISGRREKLIRMHNLIFGKMKVDHINGDGLDNRRENLRKCTNSQNMANSKKRIGTSSKYKGVCWCKRENKWSAYIYTNKKRKSLGYFKNQKDAAKAYDKKAVELFGSFARLNLNERN